MMGYLLDTSICVAIFRGNRHVAEKLNEVGKLITGSVLLIIFYVENLDVRE